MCNSNDIMHTIGFKSGWIKAESIVRALLEYPLKRGLFFKFLQSEVGSFSADVCLSMYIREGFWSKMAEKRSHKDSRP